MSAIDTTPISSKSNVFVLGLVLLAALWIVVRPLAGQFNAYSPENGFANAIVALFGLCAGFAALQAKPRIVWPERLTLALLLYFGVLSWGLMRSPNPGQGIAQYGEALSYGALLAGGFVLTRLQPGAALLIARATLAVVATQALAAAWQHFIDLPQLWESVRGGKLAVPEELAGTAGQYRLFGSDVFGSFGNPNSLAAYLLVGLGLLAGFFMRREAGISQKSEMLSERVGVAVVALLLCAALFWTRSKGGWVAAGALIWFGVMHAAIQRKPERRTLLVRLTTIGVLLLTAVLALGYFNTLPMPDSLRVRFDYWRATAAMVADHPLQGVGLGGFFEHYSFYKVPLGTETRDAHNDYVHFLAELGILGPLMYVALWSVLLRGKSPVDDVGDGTTKYESVLMLTGVAGFLMMFLGFQALNAADLPALISGEGGAHAVKSLAITVLIPVLFAITFRISRGLTLTQVWRGFGCAAGAILIHQMVDFDFKAPAVMGSLFLLGGALLGEREREEEAGDGVSLKKASLTLLPIFAAILMILGVWYPFTSGLARKNALVLEEWMREPVEKRELSHDIEVRELIAMRERAATAAPFDSQAWLDLADALRIQYRKKREVSVRKRILEAYSRAVARRPLAAAPHVQLANFQLDSLERGTALEMGRSRMAMAAHEYGIAAKRYPLHPGMPLWEGDALLLSGEIESACAAYMRAFAIDRKIFDANVRLSACFTDPQAGALPRHGLETEVLMSVIHLLQTPEFSPEVRRGLELRRVLGLAGGIRSLERSSLAEEKNATRKIRAELGSRAAQLPTFFENDGDRAHAAFLAAMSWEMAGPNDTVKATAWQQARDLRAKAISSGVETTPERLFTVLESYFGRGGSRN